MDANLPIKPGASTSSNAVSVIDAAVTAIALANTPEAVVDIHQRLDALRAQAKILKDPEREAQALEGRMRAARKLGEMLRGLDVRRGRRGKSSDEIFYPKLDEIGVDKRLSRQSQAYAALPAEEFEAKVEEGREKIVSGVAKILNAVGRKKKLRVERPGKTLIDRFDAAAPGDRFALTKALVGFLGVTVNWKGLSPDRQAIFRSKDVTLST